MDVSKHTSADLVQQRMKWVACGCCWKSGVIHSHSRVFLRKLVPLEIKWACCCCIRSSESSEIILAHVDHSLFQVSSILLASVPLELGWNELPEPFVAIVPPGVRPSSVRDANLDVSSGRDHPRSPFWHCGVCPKHGVLGLHHWRPQPLLFTARVSSNHSFAMVHYAALQQATRSAVHSVCMVLHVSAMFSRSMPKNQTVLLAKQVRIVSDALIASLRIILTPCSALSWCVTAHLCCGTRPVSRECPTANSIVFEPLAFAFKSCCTSFVFLLAVSTIGCGPRAGQHGRGNAACEATESSFTPICTPRVSDLVRSDRGSV